MPIFTEQIELQLTYNIHINTPIFCLRFILALYLFNSIATKRIIKYKCLGSTNIWRILCYVSIPLV